MRRGREAVGLCVCECLFKAAQEGGRGGAQRVKGYHKGKMSAIAVWHNECLKIFFSNLRVTMTSHCKYSLHLWIETSMKFVSHRQFTENSRWEILEERVKKKNQLARAHIYTLITKDEEETPDTATAVKMSRFVFISLIYDNSHLQLKYLFAKRWRSVSRQGARPTYYSTSWLSWFVINFQTLRGKFFFTLFKCFTNSCHH